MPDRRQRSAEIMALVDGLTKPQRRLVHEYGLVLVLRVLADEVSVPRARRVLEGIRRARQAAFEGQA